MKSKKRHVLSSDDEDDVPCTPLPIDKPMQKINEKQKVIINPVDVFGLEPVKQNIINVPKPKKKKQVRIYCMIVIYIYLFIF